MKVLHVDTGREWRGGQQQVLYLTQGLEDRGVTSVVVTPQGSPLAQRLRARSLPLIEIPYSAPYAPRTIRALQRILADRSYEILHLHTSHAHTLGFLSFRLPPRRAFQKPVFLVSRRVDFRPGSDPISKLKYTASGQHIVCVSEAIRQILLDYGVAEKSLSVVRSGVVVPDSVSSLERSRLRETLGVPSDAPLVGAIGQLVPHKGHRHLLSAFAIVRRSVPNAHLVVIGEGELLKTLESKTRELGIEGAVTWAGYRARAARYLDALDLFVHPSVEEGLGTSILDAGARRVAIVATRAGGIPETIKHRETGILVEPGQADSLALEMVGLLLDPGRRAELGQAAREWVGRQRSEVRMIEQSLALYRSLAGSAR